MHRGDGKAVADLFKRDICLGFHLLGSELGLTKDQRQRHGETSRVCGSDQLLRVGTWFTLETAGEAVGVLFQGAALG